jgi:hypothetical protein
MDETPVLMNQISSETIYFIGNKKLKISTQN